MYPPAEDSARAMVTAARAFYGFGWLLGTSGNLSVRLSEDRFLITASGKDKGALSLTDFLICGMDGLPAEPTQHRPSAETLVHTVVYAKMPEVGAIYHVHEIHAALCSERERDRADQFTEFSGLEMIKGLDIWEPDAVVRVPIVPNHAAIPDLAQAIDERIDATVPGIMVERHGFYAWGKDAAAAKRHVETLAYLYRYSYLAKPLIAER